MSYNDLVGWKTLTELAAQSVRFCQCWPDSLWKHYAYGSHFNSWGYLIFCSYNYVYTENTDEGLPSPRAPSQVKEMHNLCHAGYMITQELLLFLEPTAQVECHLLMAVRELTAVSIPIDCMKNCKKCCSCMS